MSTRLHSLDILRGIAILGTLGTNIWIFTNPEGLIGYINGTPAVALGEVQEMLKFLAQGKFLGLLTVMFGIGLALQQQSATRAGTRWPSTYPWRAFLLFVDGAVHFLLFTEFDVLMGYAVTGAVVAYLLATSQKAQRRFILVASAIHVSLLALITLALLMSTPPQSGAGKLEPNPYADGSFWDLVVFRLEHVVIFRLETVFIFPMSIALFLLGAKLYGAGVLERRGHGLRKRLMIVGFGIAAPIDFALEIYGGEAGLILGRYGIAPFVSLAILSAVGEFYLRRPAPGWGGRRLAEIGRMALTSYMLQNIVASAICYGWGLGLAARVDPVDRVPMTVAVYLVVVVAVAAFAHAWLRRFPRGPVEWLWNSSYQALVKRTDSPQRAATVGF